MPTLEIVPAKKATQWRKPIEKHPQYSEICKRLTEGERCTVVAKSLDPPVSSETLSRFRKAKLFPALEAAAALRMKDKEAEFAGAVVQSDYFLARVERKESRLEKAMELALSTFQLDTLARLDSADTRVLELRAKLEGRLESAGKESQKVIVVMPTPDPRMIFEEPEVIDVTPERRG